MMVVPGPTVATAVTRPMTSRRLVNSMKRERVVGKPEIAELLGVTRHAVYQWQKRGLLPAPDMTVSGWDAWFVSTIEAWAHQTNRLPTDQELDKTV